MGRGDYLQTNEKRCDLCAYSATGVFAEDYPYVACTRYHEQHLPEDGENCSGFEFWDDPEVRTRYEKEAREMERNMRLFDREADEEEDDDDCEEEAD